MKKLSTTLMALGLLAMPLFALKINDTLSVEGFLDMSAGGEINDSAETFGGNFDQLEVDILLNFGNISARADINAAGTDMVTFEQGFITGTTGDVSVHVGRFLSSSGWEAAEPTGLYQYSYSKNCDESVTGCVYGGYQNGLALAFNQDMFALYGAVITNVWDNTDTDFATPGFEGQVSLMPTKEVTAKVAYLHQIYDEDISGDAGQGLMNAWISYAKGPVTVAGEYNLLLDWVSSTANDEMGHGWLGMVNYAVTDKLGATVRYSGIKIGDDDMGNEVTFSPGFAITDNWFGLAEVKYNIDSEVTEWAVESLFSY